MSVSKIDMRGIRGAKCPFKGNYSVRCVNFHKAYPNRRTQYVCACPWMDESSQTQMRYAHD